jgi:hypothetical protein
MLTPLTRLYLGDDFVMRSDPHCCEMMTLLANYRYMNVSPFEYPDNLVFYAPAYDEYGITRPGKRSYVLIHYCPWCGTRLPDSRRGKWYSTLEELGYDPHGENIPGAFLSDAWYRGSERLRLERDDQRPSVAPASRASRASAFARIVRALRIKLFQSRRRATRAPARRHPPSLEATIGSRVIVTMRHHDMGRWNYFGTDQVYGVITSVENGIAMLWIEASDTSFDVSSDPADFIVAPKGMYHVITTGEVVKDPDYLVFITVEQSQPGAEP